ncbi:MAG: hypothetical protein ACLTKI_00120 [Lachnospiraceae bacterium]
MTVKMTLPGILSGIVLVFIPSMDYFSSQISWEAARSCWWAT